MDSVKKEVADLLTVIDLHLQQAETALQEGKYTLAETEVFAAKDKTRHAQAAATKISN